MSVMARFWAALSWLYSAMKGYAVAHVAIASVAKYVDVRMVKWRFKQVRVSGH